MEAAGAVTMFERSETTRNIRYVKFLGGGDSKAFSRVVAAEPYGLDVSIEKLECVGHVQKRLGSRLRRLKTENKGKKMSDGKLSSGQGRLPDHEIDPLQNYFGQAIRNNSETLAQMKTAIWATFFHKASTDEKPQHGLCPKGATSWCRFNRSEALGQKYLHKHSLPLAVIECIKPVYQDLTKDDLLKKCLHGKTQNVNECFNNVVWTRCPKTVFVGMEVLKVGVYDAVLSFNDGNAGKLRVLEALGCEPGYNSVKQLREIVDERITKAEAAITDIGRQARKKKRNKKRKRDENNDPAVLDYGPGIA